MGRSGFSRMMKQDITYWQSKDPDKYGNTAWRRGTLIAGRWEDKVEQVQNSNGEEVVSKAIIYMLGTQVVEEDYRIAEGCFSDNTNPDELANAYRVIAVGNSPHVRNKRSLKKIWVA